MSNDSQVPVGKDFGPSTPTQPLLTVGKDFGSSDPISARPLEDFSDSFRLLENQVGKLNRLANKASETSRKASETSKVVKKDFRDLETRIDRATTFISWITGAMAFVFFVTSILICIDYFQNNEARYEKFIDKTEEIKERFYTKNEVDAQMKSLKGCLNSNRWLNPKCLD